ncbi:MAG: hypothetical protein AB1489_19015 [Acidobacteriota bacterium]
MFCPSCGTEERQPAQFCRACGTDMRVIRNTLQKPDAITNSAVTAREEIGRAFAAKIQELKTTKDLEKVVENVLPEIEKFLEAPEERRLRRLRAGVITAAVGLGAMIILIISPKMGLMVMGGWASGLLVFLIGLGIVINGLLFTIPEKTVADRSLDAKSQNVLDRLAQPPPAIGEETVAGEKFLSPPPSVTEHTTHQLPEEPLKVPKIRNTK